MEDLFGLRVIVDMYTKEFNALSENRYYIALKEKTILEDWDKNYSKDSTINVKEQIEKLKMELEGLKNGGKFSPEFETAKEHEINLVRLEVMLKERFNVIPVKNGDKIEFARLGVELLND